LAEEKKEQAEKVTQKINERTEKKMLEEYNALNQANNSRWSDTLLVDSIMIPASLIAISWALAERANLGVISIAGIRIAFAGLFSLLALILIGIALHDSLFNFKT
jgi:hypothetical protein